MVYKKIKQYAFLLKEKQKEVIPKNWITSFYFKKLVLHSFPYVVYDS